MNTAAELEEFLTKKMRMAAIYQPVIIRLLLENGGKVDLKQIAEFIAPLDSEIVSYYVARLKEQPREVLKKHGIAEIPRGAEAFQFIQPIALSKKERDTLIEICDAKIHEWLAKHPEIELNNSGWGRIRHEMIASHRYCSMCGLTPDDGIKLDIDHIIPRSHGGTNEKSNLQVLCHKCNRGKGNASIISSREARYKVEPQGDCPFCSPLKRRTLFETDWVTALSDTYPVTAGHTLIVPNRHIALASDLSEKEWLEIHRAFTKVRALLEGEDSTIEGYNTGFNIGEAAGQTVLHAHFHIIPRRKGDQPDPRGGIRGVIPEKKTY